MVAGVVRGMVHGTVHGASHGTDYGAVRGTGHGIVGGMDGCTVGWYGSTVRLNDMVNVACSRVTVDATVLCTIHEMESRSDQCSMD